MHQLGHDERHQCISLARDAVDIYERLLDKPVPTYDIVSEVRICRAKG
jgi:hypothetical protein